jgi:uncharacterized protein (TIGR01777 family)
MGALRFDLRLPVSAAQGFAWHEREGAFERLSPPWQPVRILERSGGIRDGARVTLDLGFPAGRWRLEHFDYRAGDAFHDRQLSGPFARYEHAHRFMDDGGIGVLSDELRFALPLAPLSAPAEFLVRARFQQLFAWRHRVTRADLLHVARHKTAPLTIGVTGASGFIGTHLCAFLTTQGHSVKRFVRESAAATSGATIAWDPARGELDPSALIGLDAVVHLAGAGIADAPWTSERKRELVESRVQSTRTLSRSMAAALAHGGPRVLVSTSAIGYYGDRADEKLTEASPAGKGFLAELAVEWERAADPAREAGIRVVHPRIGIVLWPSSGALAKLALPFFFGAGGPLGDGKAWWSWISLHDLLDSLLWAVEDGRADGAFNAVSPRPVRQRDLARALGRVLSRPWFAPAPAFALRALLGREQADEMLLGSQHVLPWLLEAAGFEWRDSDLETALGALYGRPRLEGRS